MAFNNIPTENYMKKKKIENALNEDATHVLERVIKTKKIDEKAHKELNEITTIHPKTEDNKAAAFEDNSSFDETTYTQVHTTIKELLEDKNTPQGLKEHLATQLQVFKDIHNNHEKMPSVKKTTYQTATEKESTTDPKTIKAEKEILDDAEKLEVEISQKEKVFKLLIERYGQIRELDQKINEGNLSTTIIQIRRHLEDIINGLKGILARHKNNSTNVAIAKGHDSFKFITEIDNSLNKKGITLKKYHEIITPISQFPIILCKDFAYELEVTVDAKIVKIESHINTRDKGRPETVKVYAGYINVYKDILVILQCITRDQTESSAKITADIERLDTSTATTKKLREELSRITGEAVWLYRVYQQLKQH